MKSFLLALFLVVGLPILVGMIAGPHAFLIYVFTMTFYLFVWTPISSAWKVKKEIDIMHRNAPECHREELKEDFRKETMRALRGEDK